MFKTHLDIGFTGLAADVLEQYRTRFIPQAVDLALAVNTPGDTRFVWTVGSYLVKYMLEHSEGAAHTRFCEALRKGHIRWHGLACTTHTELMDEALLGYSLSISQGLDEAFGQKTIAAKMTDVPGHTIGIVPPLCAAGIRYLHIGVNASSRVPVVPQLFRWRCGGSELAVQYAGSYGQSLCLPNGVALEFAHTHDNDGPQTREGLEALYADLQAKYPGARIQAGTLDDFAAELPAVWNTLPVVEGEIGDTWIHGIASDPLKTAQFWRLQSLKQQWLAAASLAPDTPAYEGFMENLLLVAEHTWGMDSKKHLLDFCSWAKPDFAAARRTDTTSLASYGKQNSRILERMRPELEQYLGKDPHSSYTKFEQSHAEQRGYIGAALNALPKALRQQAERELAFAWPELEGRELAFTTGEMLEVAGWRLAVGPAGELVCLQKPGWQSPRQVCYGLFEYEVFGGDTAKQCYLQYGRDLDTNFFWAEPDFGRPCLEAHKEIADGCWWPCVSRLVRQGNTLGIYLQMPGLPCKEYGCPREALVQHTFAPTGITTTLHWRGKDASRIPEALWLTMDLGLAQPGSWLLDKLGTPVDPQGVVPGGSRRLHCAAKLRWQGTSTDAAAEITPLDAPLACLGGRGLYDVSDTPAPPGGRVSYLLYNNRWGTNFKLWFEEDMRFTWQVTL